MKIREYLNRRVMLASLFLLFLTIYYSEQKQIDFAVFWSAGHAAINGKNPYSIAVQEASGWHMFVNSPSSLLFFGLIGLFPLSIASYIFRILSIIAMMMAAKILHETFDVPKYLIYTVFLLSVPFRTTIGSGQVGLFVLLSTVKLTSQFYKQEDTLKIKDLTIAILCCFTILSFKPYMFIGVAIYLFIKKKFLILTYAIAFFIGSTLILSMKYNLLSYWLSNLESVGRVTLLESNNSSIIALSNRVTNQLWLAITIYILVNLFLIIKLITNQHNSVQILVMLFLCITLSPYVHHQDYLVIIFNSILIHYLFNITNIRKLDSFVAVGLQPNSLAFTLLYEAWKLIDSNKKNYSMIISISAIILSLLSAIFWHSNYQLAAFIVYDLTYLFWMLTLIYTTTKKLC